MRASMMVPSNGDAVCPELAAYCDALHTPGAVIFVYGPTGSGKTRTMGLHFPSERVHRPTESQEFSMDGLDIKFHLAVFLDEWSARMLPRAMLLVLLDRETWKLNAKFQTASDTSFDGTIVLANVAGPTKPDPELWRRLTHVVRLTHNVLACTGVCPPTDAAVAAGAAAAADVAADNDERAASGVGEEGTNSAASNGSSPGTSGYGHQRETPYGARCRPKD
jgi:hypothetical protein